MKRLLILIPTAILCGVACYNNLFLGIPFTILLVIVNIIYIVAGLNSDKEKEKVRRMFDRAKTITSDDVIRMEEKDGSLYVYYSATPSDAIICDCLRIYGDEKATHYNYMKPYADVDDTRIYEEGDPMFEVLNYKYLSEFPRFTVKAPCNCLVEYTSRFSLIPGQPICVIHYEDDLEAYYLVERTIEIEKIKAKKKAALRRKELERAADEELKDEMYGNSNE